jgi:hypothetical protein
MAKKIFIDPEETRTAEFEAEEDQDLEGDFEAEDEDLSDEDDELDQDQEGLDEEDTLESEHESTQEQQRVYEKSAEDIRDDLKRSGIAIIAEETHCHENATLSLLKSIAREQKLFGANFRMITHNDKGLHRYGSSKAGYWLNSQGNFRARHLDMGRCPPDTVYFKNITKAMDEIAKGNASKSACQSKVVILTVHCMDWVTTDQKKFLESIQRLKDSGAEEVIVLSTQYGSRHSAKTELEALAQSAGARYVDMCQHKDLALMIAAEAAVEYIVTGNPEALSAEHMQSAVKNKNYTVERYVPYM